MLIYSCIHLYLLQLIVNQFLVLGLLIRSLDLIRYLDLIRCLNLLRRLLLLLWLNLNIL